MLGRTSISGTFPWLFEPFEQISRPTQSSCCSRGNVAVLSIRAVTGFGGIIAVGAVLLAVQFITGVQAFPL